LLLKSSTLLKNCWHISVIVHNINDKDPLQDARGFCLQNSDLSPLVKNSILHPGFCALRMNGFQ